MISEALTRPMPTKALAMLTLVSIALLAGASGASAQMSQGCYDLRNGYSWSWTPDQLLPDPFIYGGTINPDERILLTIESKDKPGFIIGFEGTGELYWFADSNLSLNHLLVPDEDGQVFEYIDLGPGPWGPVFEAWFTMTCLPAGASATNALCEVRGISLATWIYREPSLDGTQLRFLEDNEPVTIVGCTSDGQWCEARFGLLDRRGYVPGGAIAMPGGIELCGVTPDYDPVPTENDDPPSSPTPSIPGSGGAASGAPASSGGGSGGGGLIGGSNPAPPQEPVAPSSSASNDCRLCVD